MSKTNIVSELEEILKKVDEERPELVSPSLAKANDHYNEMVKNGLIRKRGYTLRGIEDTHLIKGYCINAD